MPICKRCGDWYGNETSLRDLCEECQWQKDRVDILNRWLPSAVERLKDE